jgi:hypothetical protein
MEISKKDFHLVFRELTACCKARTEFASSDAGILGSNSNQSMDVSCVCVCVCVCVRLVCVVVCLGSGLATGLSLMQGVLPSVK